MKLVEILARELKEWPSGGCNYIAQDYDGDLGSYRYKPKLVSCDKNDHVWHNSGHIMNLCNLSCVADDACEAIVTRADWGSELARLYSELTAKPAKKPNKDGWIRHRGGKCPVEAGALVDVRYRDGEIDEFGRDAGRLDWSHHSDIVDIMSYRIHKPAEQGFYADDKDESSDPVQVTYADADGPLLWRDRITEIDHTVEALEEERVALVQRLEVEGLQLLQAKACGSVHPIEDMSDWRNWKAGDQVKVILANDCTGLWIDRVVTVRSIEPANYGGSMPVSVFYDGDWNFPEAHDGSDRCVFEFHSRPSK